MIDSMMDKYTSQIGEKMCNFTLKKYLQNLLSYEDIQTNWLIDTNNLTKHLNSHLVT